MAIFLIIILNYATPDRGVSTLFRANNQFEKEENTEFSVDRVPG